MMWIDEGMIGIDNKGITEDYLDDYQKIGDLGEMYN